jgi:hypothetical protein
VRTSGPVSSRPTVRDFTSAPAPPPPAGTHAALPVLRGTIAERQNGQRLAAGVVVTLIAAATGLSVYDLYLFLTLVAR